MHKTLIEKYGTPLTSGALSMASDLNSNGWVRLGYDVIDINRLISGLLNCGPNSSALKEEFSPYINKFALFEELSVAQKFAQKRDVQIPKHSPFYPVALWKK